MFKWCSKIIWIGQIMWLIKKLDFSSWGKCFRKLAEKKAGRRNFTETTITQTCVVLVLHTLIYFYRVRSYVNRTLKTGARQTWFVRIFLKVCFGLNSCLYYCCRVSQLIITHLLFGLLLWDNIYFKWVGSDQVLTSCSHSAVVDSP